MIRKFAIAQNFTKVRVKSQITKYYSKFIFKKT